MNTYLVPVFELFEWQKGVLDKNLSSPPLSPSKGDRYIVGVPATGAWTGQDDNIVFWDGSQWVFIPKFEGMIVYVKSEHQWYIYITSWVIFPRGPIAKQTEIDFGSLPISEARFMVVDNDVNIASHVTGSIAYEAPTGKDLDEVEMDQIDIIFGSGVGQLSIYARGMEGYLHDKFKVNYLIG